MTDTPGPGVDARGRPVDDPTANVISILHAAVQRLDDLRENDKRHVREIMDLRADHYRELRLAEAQRINAIRDTDVAAAARRDEIVAAQQLALAAQQAASAETLRNQVEQTRVQTASALEAALTPIKTDIADLRRSQSEGVGQKTQVVDARSGTTLLLGVAVAVLVLISLLTSIYAATR